MGYEDDQDELHESGREIHRFKMEGHRLRAEITQLRTERDEAHAEVKLEKQLREACKASIVDTVGGSVEGAPTHSGNYLQRLRELVAAEAEVARRYKRLMDELGISERDIALRNADSQQTGNKHRAEEMTPSKQREGR